MDETSRRAAIQEMADAIVCAANGRPRVTLPDLDPQDELAPIASAVNRLLNRSVPATTRREENLPPFLQVVESLNEAVSVVDTEGVLTYVNRQFCRMLGVNVGELVGSRFPDLLEGLDRKLWFEQQATRKLGNFTRYELTIRKRDGGCVTCIASGSPLFGDGGKFIGSVGVLTNITRRREEEEELRLFRLSLAEAPDSVYWITEAGGFSYVNEEACRSLGYSRPELLGLHLWDIDPVFPKERFARNWQLQRASNDVWTLKHETMHRRKDGSLFPVEVSAKHFWSGNNEYHVAFVRDISERKAAEQKLRFTQYAIEEASIGCFWIDADAHIQYVNRQACRSLGYTPEELSRMTVMDIDPLFSGEAWEGFWQELLAKKVLSLETTHQRKDGTRFPVVITANYIELGGQEYSCAYVQDLSDLKRREEALHISEERLRQAVRVAKVGIFDHDHVTDSLYASPQLKEILGWNPDEPLTLPGFLTHVHPEDRARVLTSIQNSHDPAGDGRYDEDARILQPNGAVRWTTTQSLTFFEGEGEARRPVRTVGAAHDITAKRRSETEATSLQAQLLQAQKMESVGRLAGGVAHDFNNMLGVILGHLEMVQPKLPSNSPALPDLQYIQEAAERSADLTRQLLAFASKQTIAPKVLDLNASVNGMLQMLRRLIGEDITVGWEPDRGLWTVRIDPAQVHQILANLLVNSRDAIEGRGKVVLHTENTVLDEAFCARHPGSAAGAYVKLSVQDDGCGMDKETLEHVFEPFFTTKKMGQGTGLGMATVYGIVKQNDGFISAFSEPDQGTTVEVFLPKHGTETPPEEVASQEEAPAGGNETILVVEDEPMVLELAISLLESLGYHALAADTCDEAIRLAEEHAGPIHLLMTDVILPDMSGREIAARLHEVFPSIGCLFMSGYTADVISHRGMLDADVHFLQKPFLMKDLAAKVREALQGKR